MTQTIRAAEFKELGPGQMKLVNLNGKDIVLANVNGELVAFDNRCTHVGGPLSQGKLEGYIVTCPWHGSKFNVKTGAVVGPPARTPVKTYKVRVEGLDVKVEMPG